MSNLLQLTEEQKKAYNRFIAARDKLGYGLKNRNPKWVNPSEVEGCVDVEGFNHPLFIVNEVYLEYVNAFQAWLDIEPRFRDEERMRSSRGDYGLADTWEQKSSKAGDVFNKLREEK